MFVSNRNIGKKTFVTHRRIIAERGGCFQRRLFVCLFVNTVTSKGLNVGWWNFAVRCIVQKSRPSSNVKIKGQRSPGTRKNEKVRHFVRELFFGARSSCGIFFGSGPRRPDPRGPCVRYMFAKVSTGVAQQSTCMFSVASVTCTPVVK